MKKTTLTALMMSIIGLTPIIYERVVSHDKYMILGIGIMIIKILIVYIVVGAIFLNFKNTNEIGKGLFLSAGNYFAYWFRCLWYVTL
jgi:hypothetical protein